MSSEVKLLFRPSQSEEQIKEIYNSNTKAFAGGQDFSWTEESIKNEIMSGWQLYSAHSNNDIVAAIFLKIEDGKLLTKNTPIKIAHQGNGYSHIIKEFYEKFAKDNSIKTIFNYCSADNFRMISLNEGHDYSKTGNTLGDKKNIIEWKKTLP